MESKYLLENPLPKIGAIRVLKEDIDIIENIVKEKHKEICIKYITLDGIISSAHYYTYVWDFRNKKTRLDKNTCTRYDFLMPPGELYKIVEIEYHFKLKPQYRGHKLNRYGI